MAGKISLRDVKDGVASLNDLLKINALLDFEQAQQAAAQEKQR